MVTINSSTKFKKGYLISRYDFSSFDEIIQFILEDGSKISLFAAGTRKILSKNARNLREGCLIEIEYFEARSENKLSRLKKASIITEHFSNYLDLNKHWIHIINQYLEKKVDCSLSEFQLIELMYKKHADPFFKDKSIVVYLMLEIMKREGYNFNLDYCFLCGQEIVYGFSFKYQSVICKECSTKDAHVHKGDDFKNFISYLKNGNENIYRNPVSVMFFINLFYYLKDVLGINIKSLNNFFNKIKEV